MSLTPLHDRLVVRRLEDEVLGIIDRGATNAAAIHAPGTTANKK